MSQSCHCRGRSDVEISHKMFRIRRSLPKILSDPARLPRPLQGLAMTSATFSTSKRINEMYRPESRTVSLSKSPFGSFAKLPSKLQNFFCTVLQFCRCGGLLNAKGNPDGFLSHFSSLRNLRLGSFFASPFRKNEMYRPASRTVHFEEKKERKREKKEKKHEKERGCDLWKTSDQGRGLSCSDGSSALADVVGSSFCTASSLLSNTMGRRNVLP